jgi:hypothetical protein
MFLYLKEGMEWSLNEFFEETAEANLIIDSLFRLAAEFVILSEKIEIPHGKRASLETIPSRWLISAKSHTAFNVNAT